MPNWCVNDLTITAPTNVIQAILDSQLSLQKLFPCPQELLDTSAPAGFNDPDKAKINKEKYGHADWYSWQVSNWGTKWDIGPLSEIYKNDNLDGTSTISVGFDSAWSPPVSAVQKLYEKFKNENIQIRLEYFESGCAFLGVAETSSDGFLDTCYDYESSDELQAFVDQLGHELASSEVDYLREREEEEREYELEKKLNEESKPVALDKPSKKTTIKKKTSIKKNSKKNATKVASKKASKKTTKQPTNKATKKTTKKTTKQSTKKALKSL